MDIDTLVNKIRATPSCQVYDPIGFPALGPNHVLPEDLKQFYTICGGVSLFDAQDYSLLIVPPTRCVLANPVIVGSIFEDDITATWYIIGDDGNGDYLTIDFSKERLGMCYDSFHEIHGLRGNCPVIARSFTDLLSRLYDNGGQYWYWLQSDFVSLGDAYDV
ncbi:SMI1/KNR4 family protein [Dictyobacter kobayashii]|uniref:SMI1/KNR4 family protein n=1 Tax=Dictyobacter kobayashii TaxID=2014872 RepID=A0A402AVS5_9CHLR|nr:SMI1/KNR4 family protein [Dictyobacter kobayashii]GCE23165.1 SMI1/KNR4 family protein [Dictyobacter kobayashii]